MSRVESIKEPLHTPSSLSIVEEKENKPEEGVPVDPHVPHESVKDDTRHDLGVQSAVVQHDKDVDQSHRHHIVVQLEHQSKDQEDKDGDDAQHSGGLGVRLLRETVERHKPDYCPGEGEHDVLVGELQHFSCCQEVKGGLADQPEDQQSYEIFLSVMGVEVPLRHKEGKDGHRDAPYDPHPGPLREKVISHMVKHHGDHSDQF